MKRVEFTPVAAGHLDRLIETHSLPADTWARVERALGLVAVLPDAGGLLGGRYRGSRFVVGPWRWMLLVYEYEEESNRLFVVAIHDARSSSAATTY